MAHPAAWHLGQTSEHYESGGHGPGTISTGAGDHGGASYGTYQLSSHSGTLQEYLAHSVFEHQFHGLQPATPAFDARWRGLALSDPAFAQDQHAFIKRTHYDQQVARLQSDGLDLSRRGPAVQDALWSTAVQYRNRTREIFEHGLREKFGSHYQLSNLSDRDIVEAVQDYKAAQNDQFFASSSQTLRASVLRRIQSERVDLVALAEGRLVDDGIHAQALKEGMRGPDIHGLQHRLNELGYSGNQGHPLQVDGFYGPATRAAVMAFQRDRGLIQDGVAGAATQQRLHDGLRGSQEATAVLNGGVPVARHLRNPEGYVGTPSSHLRETEGLPPNQAGVPPVRDEPTLPTGHSASSQPSIPPHLQDFRHPDHPAHACYTCALQQVHAMEERAGVVHGPHSERAAAAVAAAVAAHDVGKSPMARMDVPAHISLRGEGVAQQLVVSAARVNYYQPEITLTLPVEKATAATVEQSSLDWSRLHLPHLHAQPPEQRRDPGKHTATPERGTHQPQASSHPWYETVREQIARSYDTYGLPRVGERIDQLAAAALAKIEGGLIDVAKPLRMSLGQDPHTGVIGPHSDLLIRQPHASLGLLVVALHGDERLPRAEHPQPAASDLRAQAHAPSV